MTTPCTTSDVTDLGGELAVGIGIEESYQTQVIPNFKWADWIDPKKVMKTPHRRVDVDYKNWPYRGRPIEGPQQ